MAVVVSAGAGGVIRRSSAVFLHALPAFLLVSLLLLSFRSAVHLGTLSLSSFLHHDPSVRSLLARLDPSRPPSSPPSPSLPLAFERRRRLHHPDFPPPHHRRRLHHPHFPNPSSRVDYDANDDVFSDTGLQSFLPRRPYRHHPPPLHSSSHNSSFLPRNDGPLQAKKVRTWNANPSASAAVLFVEDDFGEDDRRRSSTFASRLLGTEGFDLDRSDAVTLVYLACLFSAAHAYAIIGFMFSYSCAVGIVYVASAVCLLRRRLSIFGVIYYGSKLGIHRLSVLLFLRWSMRDALMQLLSIVFFSEIEDQFSLLKLFVKVKLMPFIMTAPPPSLQFEFGDVSTDGLLLYWTTFDAVIGVVFSMACWVAVMERSGGRRSGQVQIKEGYHLLSVLLAQAIFLKLLEMLICGILGARVMNIVGGQAFSMAMQSALEVYFMIVWLMFYFAARFRAGEMDGRSFGWGDLEESFNECLR